MLLCKVKTSAQGGNVLNPKLIAHQKVCRIPLSFTEAANRVLHLHHITATSRNGEGSRRIRQRSSSWFSWSQSCSSIMSSTSFRPIRNLSRKSCHAVQRLGFGFEGLHSPKLTWKLIQSLFRRTVVFIGLVLGFHVSFRQGRLSDASVRLLPSGIPLSTTATFGLK